MDNDHEVSVRLSRIQSTTPRRNGVFELRIEDDKSGLLVAIIELDSEAIADLVSQRSAYGTAELFSDSARCWGKMMKHDVIPVPVEHSDSVENAEDWIRHHQKENGWDVSSVRRNGRHGGFIATFRKWT